MRLRCIASPNAVSASCKHVIICLRLLIMAFENYQSQSLPPFPNTLHLSSASLPYDDSNLISEVIDPFICSRAA